MLALKVIWQMVHFMLVREEDVRGDSVSFSCMIPWLLDYWSVIHLFLCNFNDRFSSYLS